MPYKFIGLAGYGTRRTVVDGDAYYLYDTFDSNAPAGAVNGTQAEPVGGARTVTDTNGKISISGGVLSFATGLAINDKVAWTAIPRALGLGVKSSITLSNLTSKPNIGWGAADLFIFDSVGTGLLYANINGTAFPVIGTYSATTYETMVIYRATGAFWFIKGGAFTNWTMLYNSALGTANRTPQVLTQIAASIFTVDNMRVPKQKYIPVPLQSDGMSAATTDGLGNPENNGTAGNTYTDVGTWGVAGGKRAITADALSISVLPTTTRNVLIEVDIVRGTGNPGIVARYLDTSNYIQCLYDGTNVVVSQRVAGTLTVLSTTAATYSAGATMKFIADGTTYRAFYNNIAAGSGNLPDTSNMYHGIWSNSTTNTFDNLVIWARSGYEGLNQL